MAERIKFFSRLFLIATLSALLVRLFLVEDYRIKSNSMFPTLWVGDLTFVSKSAFNIRVPFSTYEIIKFKRPDRNEVVAFTLPDKGNDTFVKRVIGLDGDVIAIKNNQLLVNGAVVPSPFMQDSQLVPDYGPVDVPKDHFFAMGDNRADSIDSRKWGPVPYSCLKGRVVMVWLSLADNGTLRADRFGTIVR